MSCIAGVFARGGAPVDRAVVERMLAEMSLRAPDGHQLHCTPNIGLGQAFLCTGSSAAEQSNALTLDGEVFITADCRIDGRADLVRKLKAAGRNATLDTPHAELVLHAYHAFGEALTDHLIGDFSFVIWDARQSRLICIRDHLGVRPFYYFVSEDLFVFASQADAVLAHAGVPSDLDAGALAEFLMFGTCLDPSRTVYRHIRCLPRACRLVCSGTRHEQVRYWSLPREDRLPRQSQEEYVEAFSELFTQAVRDRLPSGAVALQLSGGMDSTSIAAVAAGWAAVAGQAVTAHHASFASLGHGDEETRLAALVAETLQMRIHIQDVSDQPLFSNWRAEELRTPLPIGTARLAVHRDTLKRVDTAGARVMLSGYGGDAIFAPSSDYFPGLLRSGRLMRFAREALDHYREARSLRGLGLRAMVWPQHGKDPAWKPRRPAWIADTQVPAGELDAKWQEWWQQFHAAASTHEQLDLPWTSRPFEEHEYLKAPLVWRYPLLDIRLIRYVSRMPAHMLMGKKVLRAAMRQRLPAAIVDRPKTAMPIDVVHQLVTNGKIHLSMTEFPPAVDPEKFSSGWKAYCADQVSDATWTSGLIMLPLALRNWISTRSARNES